jgi:hypothetical protein
MRNAGIHGHAVSNKGAGAAPDSSGDERGAADLQGLNLGAPVSHLGSGVVEDGDQVPFVAARREARYSRFAAVETGLEDGCQQGRRYHSVVDAS